MMIGPVELVVAAFNDEGKADEVLKTMKQLDQEGTIAVLNAAVMVKKEDGRVSIKETEDVDAKRGAVFGAVVGGLVGLLGGPAGLIVGAAAGAATGGVAAKQIDMGFSDETLQELQEGLQPGSSAIVALIQHEWVDRVVAELENLGARLFRQTLKEEIAAQLGEETEGEAE
jgi:uncharacterized membrane protein